MYELHNLGWKSFQQLCLTIAREVLGQTVQSFLDSHDGGRDGAFTGTWNPNGVANLSGRFVIQCKFTSRSGRTLRPSDLRDEVAKVERLVAKDLCDSYVLMTNAGLSGTAHEDIEAVFIDAGVKHFALLGSTWINDQILENKRLRMLVPRIYGLGDLSQILDERAYEQARAILESRREEFAKVVVTEAYLRAAEALDEHSFVLLVGEPAAGKTTIASMLAMAALDQWNASLLALTEPGKLTDHWNPDEPSQFFWIDDAFGITQYEQHLVHGWNRILPQLSPMLRKGAKIVMTSRDYIYNRARRDLKESAFPLLNEAQVVIDVHALPDNEKQQILYNHLKLGKQPISFRTEIKPFLEAVAAHPRFIPEIARQLADPLFTRDLAIESYSLGRFVEQREQLLQDVLHRLDSDSKAALALIYMRNDNLESPIELRPSEVDAIQRLGSSLGGCITALQALDGSLVSHTHASGDSVWRFKHPTIGDAYATTLAQSPELLGIYLQGSAPERLVNQITCGDVGIEHAIIVPTALHQMVLTKLEEITMSHAHKDAWLAAFYARKGLQRFLALRCSREFLTLYLEHNPDLLTKVSNPGLSLSVAPEVQLAARLHELGLLPEENRTSFVATVSKYAVDGHDTDALDSSTIRGLFTEDEFLGLVEQVREHLLPRLGEVRRDHEANLPADEPPEEHIYAFLSSLDTLRECFSDDEDAVELIEMERVRVEEWVDENTPEGQPIDQRQMLGKVESSEEPSSARSIFDDIDTDNEPEEPSDLQHSGEST